MATEERSNSILTVNRGASSLKFSLYQMGPSETLVLKGEIERIGLAGSLFHVRDSTGKSLVSKGISLAHHREALRVFLEWFQSHTSGQTLDAVGHRLVHGGTKYHEPHLITRPLMSELRKLTTLDPDHLPYEIEAIEAVGEFYPDVRQVACFDTAFHRSMPKVAQLYPLPRYLWDEGVLRYGFHGLSCEFIIGELAEKAGSEAANGRVVIAHLGDGASMTAVCGGRSVDTTMGFTPTGGLVMSTRSGDLDPGVILYLLQKKAMTAAEVKEFVNRRAGVLGVSGTSSDMRDLIGREGTDPHAREATDLFYYQAKKYLGALVAVLGGLDTFIFTGGIGENAPVIRWRICQNLDFLGVAIDSVLNESNAAIISCDDSAITVRVMKTNEELIIARHTDDLLRRHPRGEERGATDEFSRRSI